MRTALAYAPKFFGYIGLGSGVAWNALRALPNPEPTHAAVCGLLAALPLVAFLYAFGQPAFIAGDRIIRAEQHFAVIEGCSGMRPGSWPAHATIIGTR